MEWNQLEKFVVAAREENLSRAAEILNVSQPSLSQIIKRLEEELGYPLFVREGKRLRLNESGRILMQTAMQMEELLGSTRLRLEELNGVSHPEVSLHVASASPLLPELLLFLRKRTPRIRYRISQWQAESGESEADIQILAGPIGNPEYIDMMKQGLKTEHKTEGSKDEILLTEEICLALPVNHPLLRQEKILLKDLEQEDFIGLNEHWALGREIKREMEGRLFTPRVTMQVDNPNMMRELLKAHMGIGFVPSVSWRTFAGESLMIRPVEDFHVSRLVYLHTKARKYLTKEQKECISGIKEFFDNISLG